MQTTSPEEIRTRNRRKAKSNFRKTKRYRDRVKELTAGRKCIFCGTSEKLTIHHTGGDSDYRTDEIYYRTLDQGWVVCSRNHRQYHKGKTKLCPRCKKELIHEKYESCFSCMTPEEIRTGKANHEKWNGIKRKLARADYLRAKEWKLKHKSTGRNNLK